MHGAFDKSFGWVFHGRFWRKAAIGLTGGEWLLWGKADIATVLIKAVMMIPEIGRIACAE